MLFHCEIQAHSNICAIHCEVWMMFTFHVHDLSHVVDSENQYATGMVHN